MYATQYADDFYGTGMGLTLATIAKPVTQVTGSIPVVGGVISAIGGLLGGNSKDPGRLASNNDAYNQALNSPLTLFKDQGVQPTAFLLMKSPTAQGGQGGWATDKAKNDAWTKFSSAKTTLTGRGYKFVPDGSVTAPVTTTGYQTASYGASAGGVPTAPDISSGLVKGMSGGALAVAGIAAFGIYYLMNNR